MSCDIQQDPSAPSVSSPSYLDPSDGGSVEVGSSEAHPLALLSHPPRLLQCEDRIGEEGRHWGTEEEHEEEEVPGAEGEGVQYQCDVSCYGVTVAGEVSSGGACLVTEGVDERRKYWGEECRGGEGGEGGGGGGSSWAGLNEGSPYINEIRDGCHIPAGHNQMEGCNVNDNEMLRGYHPGRWWGCVEVERGGRERNGEGRGGGGLELRGIGGRTPTRPDNYPPSRHTFDSDPLDDARHDRGRLTPQEAGKIGFPRPSGVQLPVMTIEIEKWLMGLFVSDEEDADRKKKPKNRKKGKKKRDGFHQVVTNTHYTSNNDNDNTNTTQKDALDSQGVDDNLQYEVS
ncbi:hypothetical protein Pcinc_040564 [Petrolisthes cinctipes]|uniref:Uncharacterized protein n=1 Tax=Petrolisthes cinctipes TaxID=88211 RepID=A0AAE1BLQ4_PETCI|nr:hypothetical protein Pcinc_040564 [Petrolisthes cinctipes]